jgi:hypothetical protein
VTDLDLDLGWGEGSEWLVFFAVIVDLHGAWLRLVPIEISCYRFEKSQP